MNVVKTEQILVSAIAYKYTNKAIRDFGVDFLVGLDFLELAALREEDARREIASCDFWVRVSPDMSGRMRQLAVDNGLLAISYRLRAESLAGDLRA